MSASHPTWLTFSSIIFARFAEGLRRVRFFSAQVFSIRFVFLNTKIGPFPKAEAASLCSSNSYVSRGFGEGIRVICRGNSSFVERASIVSLVTICVCPLDRSKPLARSISRVTYTIVLASVLLYSLSITVCSF